MPSTDTDWTAPADGDLEARLLAAFEAAAERTPTDVPPWAMTARVGSEGAAAPEPLEADGQAEVVWGAPRPRRSSRRRLLWSLGAAAAGLAGVTTAGSVLRRMGAGGRASGPLGAGDRITNSSAPGPTVPANAVGPTPATGPTRRWVPGAGTPTDISGVGTWPGGDVRADYLVHAGSMPAPHVSQGSSRVDWIAGRRDGTAGRVIGSDSSVHMSGALRPDGRQMALAGTGILRLIDLTGATPPRDLPYPMSDSHVVMALRYAPGGNRLAAALVTIGRPGDTTAGAKTGSLDVIDLSTDTPRIDRYGVLASEPVWSPGGGRVACRDNQMGFWVVDAGARRMWRVPKSTFGGVDGFTADGRVLCTWWGPVGTRQSAITPTTASPAATTIKPPGAQQQEGMEVFAMDPVSGVESDVVRLPGYQPVSSDPKGKYLLARTVGSLAFIDRATGKVVRQPDAGDQLPSVAGWEDSGVILLVPSGGGTKVVRIDARGRGEWGVFRRPVLGGLVP